jgi:hypothetical protein
MGGCQFSGELECDALLALVPELFKLSSRARGG